MRPNTLAEALDRLRRGEPIERATAEFLDRFYDAASAEERLLSISDEPPLTGDGTLDALLAATAEYLAKRYRLPEVPGWVCGPGRILPRPHFTTRSQDPGLREYLVYSSPAEFRSRNIFTEERPLRRASSAKAG